MFLFRFVLGGLIISAIPELAKRFGPRLAGMLVLVPAISILALYFTAQSLGTVAARDTAKSALFGLIPLTLFLFTCSCLFKRTTPTITLVVASVIWLATTSVLILIIRPNA